MSKSTLKFLTAILLIFVALIVFAFCFTSHLISSYEKGELVYKNNETTAVIEINTMTDSEEPKDTTSEENIVYTNDVVYTIYRLTVHDQPNISSDTIGYIDSDIEVTRIAIYPDDWSLISYRDLTGYVFTECLSEVLIEETRETEPAIYETDEYGDTYQIVDETVKSVGTVNVRSKASSGSAKVGMLCLYQSVNRIGIGDNGWSRIIYDGKEAYVSSYYLETTERPFYTRVEETVYATRDCNVRNGPSIQAKKIGDLKKGEELTRVSIGNNGWSRVIYNGTDAHVYSEYLKPVKNDQSPDT